MATPTTLPASFTSGQVLTAAEMNNLRGAFRVLQVVSTTKTDTFSTASTTFTDVTGMSVTITPSATTSQILVIVNTGVGNGGGIIVGLSLVRGSTQIYAGQAAGTRGIGAAGPRVDSDANIVPTSIVFLDSPATTSATTYKLQMKTGSGTSWVNRSSFDADAAASMRTASSITVMEISA